MLDREWISLYDPGAPGDRYVFDVTFLLSHHTCIYGRGCPGTGSRPAPELGCCSVGAHYVDDADEARVGAAAAQLGPQQLQAHAEARRRGTTARVPGGQRRTRVVRGGCIFLNRAGFPGGAGCALHRLALQRGEHPMAYKPEVCWMVPLRREVSRDIGDDGKERWTTTITSYDRGAWGPGGADFSWWCTEEPAAFVGDEAVYRAMEAELRAMTGDAVYDELAAYLDGRRSRARRPLPFPVYVR